MICPNSSTFNRPFSFSCWIPVAIFVLAVGIAAPLRADEPDKPIADRLTSDSTPEQLLVLSELRGQGSALEPLLPQLRELMNDDDFRVRLQAMELIGELGGSAKPAVPALIELVAAKNPIIAYNAVRTLGEIGPAAEAAVPRLRSVVEETDSQTLKVSAAIALRDIGTTDDQWNRQTIVILTKALMGKRPGLKLRAETALIEAGADAVQPMRRLLNTDSTANRIAAARVIAGLGKVAQPAMPQLLNVIETGKPRAIQAAIDALVRIDAPPEKIIDPLIELITNDDVKVRRTAGSAIARIAELRDEKLDTQIVKALAGKLTSDMERVRVTAARALGAFGPRAAPAVPDLVTALSDESNTVVFEVAESLTLIGEPAVPMLTRLLGDNKLNLLAAEILGRIGPAAKAAVPALISVLENGIEPARIEAIISLAELGELAKEAVPALREHLAEADGARDLAATIYALTRIGDRESSAAISKLYRETDDDLVRLTAAWSAATLDPENQAIVTEMLPILREGLDSDKPRAREAIADTLGTIGVPAITAAPELIAAAKKDDPGAAAAALRALLAIKAPADDVVPVAVELLNADAAQLRFTAAYVLGQLERSAVKAVPKLVGQLDAEDAAQRLVAAWAILKIDENVNPDQTIGTIVGELDHPDPRIRMDAVLIAGSLLEQFPTLREPLEGRLQDRNEDVRAAAEAQLTPKKP